MRDIDKIKRIRSGNKRAAVVLAASFGALAVIRELGKYSIPTIVLGEEYIGKSKYAIGISVNEKEEILRWLRVLPQLLGYKPVLLTDGDEYLEILYQHWDELSEAYYMPVHRNNRKLTDKLLLPQTAAEMGICVPMTFHHEQLVMEEHYPVIVKPIKAEENHTNSATPEKAYICKDSEQLGAVIRQLKSMNSRYIIQQMISGDTTSIYTVTLYRNELGAITVGCSTNKLRIFPQHYGNTSVHLACTQPKLIDYCIRLMEGVRYVGVAEIEFKCNEQTGDYYIIEVNGRFALETGITHQLNPSFVYHIYQDLICPSPNPLVILPLKKPIVWVFLFRDLRAMKSQRVNPIRSYVSYAAKYHFQNAIWSWSDPLPTLYFYKHILRKLSSKRKANSQLEQHRNEALPGHKI